MTSQHDEYGADQSQDDPVPGAAAAGEPTPGEYEPGAQSGGESPETGVTYERTGEPETTPHDEALASAAEESNPNAGGPEGLEGGMGISSERTGPYGADPSADGVQGTGSHGSAAESSYGTKTTSRGSAGGPEMDSAQQEAADEWRDSQPPASGGPGVDRTVGESNTATAPRHENDRRKNPGHSHG